MTSPIARFVAKAAHPEDIERILGRCRHDPDTGCLIWTGAVNDGNRPRVWVTDPKTGQRFVTTGRRGVWMAMTGKPVHNGWRVFGTCNDPMCMTPDHTRCGQAEAFAKHLRTTGLFKARPARIAANRATGRTRRKVLDEHMHLVHSAMTLEQIAQIIRVHPSTISRHRRSMRTVQARTHNPFAGLVK